MNVTLRGALAVLMGTTLAGGLALSSARGAGTRPLPHQLRAEQLRDGNSRGGMYFDVGDRDGMRSLYATVYIEPGDKGQVNFLPEHAEMMVHSMTISNGYSTTGGVRGGTIGIGPEGGAFTQFVTAVPAVFGSQHFTFPQPFPLRHNDVFYLSFSSTVPSGAAVWEIIFIGRPFGPGSRMEVR